jgi:lipid A ethanolaminephosphotransferase
VKVRGSAIDLQRIIVKRGMHISRSEKHSSHSRFDSWTPTSLKARYSVTFSCRSDVRFAFCVSALWLVFYNTSFWIDTVHAMWHGDIASGGFLVSLLVLVLCLQAMLLLLLPSRRLMVGVASALFILAALSSYFSMKYGIVMDKDMLRNVFETNSVESRGLISSGLMARVAVLGVVPALLVWTVRLPSIEWSRRLRMRAVAVAGILLVCALALFAASASYAVFFREYKPIRFTLMPAAPLISAIGVWFDHAKGSGGSVVNVSGQARRTMPVHARPIVLVMVVGETARAANFQLAGYSRPTNPELSAQPGLIYFPDTTSCGTATAISVPCMFSHLSRRAFDVDEAWRYTNVLDALHEAGLDVEWRDNNAGCKGVCARITQIDYVGHKDSQLCRDSYCYDEKMLEDLPARIDMLTRDTVIVLHQIGSHGPAYAERYPPEFEQFKPACHSNQLQRCTAAGIVNAYDNTIVYTDHVLARTIEILRRASDRVDSMLLYVSDHGESLGEQGLYLHGLPYAFAPDTQKKVPMLMWLSSSYMVRSGTVLDCVKSQAAKSFSHDNIYHTMLGALEVRNISYDSTLDILAPCRGAQKPSDGA